MHANEPVGRRRIIEELWGDAAPKTVNAVLNTYLSRLRRLLANGTAEQVLVTDAAGYVLRVRPQAIDVRRFEDLLDGGRRELTRGEAERASATLRDALGLWRGRPLADLTFEPFAQSEIARLDELRVTALEARIEAELALGLHESLVAELESLVAEHPYREGLRAQLMLALYRSGRQAEALETYRRARRRFSEELGIEPAPRLRELEGAILRHDSSLQAPGVAAKRAEEEERLEAAPHRRRLWLRWAVGFAVALVLAIVAALVASARHSSGSPPPLVLTGDSVVVVDPTSDTIVDEIHVGGRPTGPAVSDGSVWVANRDDDILLRIDEESREIVHTIGLGVAPTDVDVGAGSVWVLSDRALLRVDPSINDVVETIPLPPVFPLRWRHLQVGADAVFVCSCSGPPGTLIRIDAVTRSVVTVRKRPVWMISYGEGALWALTGWELDRIERIDPNTNAATKTVPLGRIGEAQGFNHQLAVGNGAVWVSAPTSLWRIDATTARFVGSVQLADRRADVSFAIGEGAVWVASSDGKLLRVDPDSQTVARTIPLGTLVYPAVPWDALAVGEGSIWLAVTSYAS